MIKIFTFLVFLLLVVTSVTLFVTQNKMQNNTETPESTGTGKALIGGDFTLTNQDGVVVSDKDFRDHVMLVFFGFTRCPDICPVTAATFAQTLEILGGRSNEVKAVFITVDPENDTAEVLKEYLGNIDKRIIGLTGTKEQIKHVTSVYKAYFAKTKKKTENTSEDPSESEHSIDHSGYVYVMDKNGEYVQHFPYNASAKEIVNAVSKLLIE